MEGWIKLDRSLLKNGFWESEAFTRGQAWVDLLLLANHKDSFFYKRGNKVTVKRGQVGRSSVELSDRWKWSRSKVGKFLKDLEKEQQIKVHKSTVTQLLTIVNYEFYQGKEQQTGQQKNNRRTTERQQKDTYKNEKEEKKEKNVKKKEEREKARPLSNAQDFYFNQQESENQAGKNESSESKKVALKKVLSTVEENAPPSIPFPDGFKKPPKAWYQDQLDQLVDENGFSPKGTWENSFASKKIKEWPEDLKRAFVEWVFHFACKNSWGVHATVIGKQQKAFNEFLENNPQEDLIKAWQRCQEENWKDWKIGLKRNKEDEQQINDKQKQGFSAESAATYSAWGGLVELNKKDGIDF